MKKVYLLLLLLFSFYSNAQIKGVVSDEKGNPLPFVNIFIEDTYIGTTTNENGQYELNVVNRKKVNLVFQYIGFKTQRHIINYTDNAVTYFDVILKEESYSLNEVVLSSKDNPANQIIRNAIANKKSNSEKTARFTADFYSKGIFKIKNVPKKIFSIKIGDLDDSLDSTGSGIIYLSETVSKLTYEKPEKLKEIIIASKISGNDNGYSYNSALGTNYDFYDNTVQFEINMISPIADNAFGYYKYTLEGTFYENNQLVNKIKVTPKRDNEPVFEGYIFIVEDSWAIYGVDLEIKGYRMKQPFVTSMFLNQIFSYNQNTQIWAKNVQSLDFEAGAFGITFNGKFTYVYSNYDFKTNFAKKTFTNEILTFEENANKKDIDYWQNKRPVPLTTEENVDYIKKDSIQKIRKSKPYLDSIDAVSNKFKFKKLLTGYTYKNSIDNWNVSYNGLINSVDFNTVQGWVFKTGFNYFKRDEENRKYTNISTDINYSESEQRFRATGSFYKRLNATNKSSIRFSGGSQARQFNQFNPITSVINMASTLLFKENYIKLYNSNFVNFSYQQELINGLNLTSIIEYSERNPLFNTSNYVLIKNNKIYTSNNPLDPNNYTTGVIEKHNLVKANIFAEINFAQKYFTRPDGKFNIRDGKYPTLYLGYEKGFASNESKYNYDLISSRLNYSKTISNKGNFEINIKAGKFFNADNISFVDYKHFNGNQTHVLSSTGNLNAFNIMPYYAFSTNKSYFEIHAEHDFKGFIMNKIPLINKLKSTLVVGYHSLATPDIKPYQEFSVGLNNLGFGKFKMLRIDYVRSYNGSSFNSDGFMFGLKF